MERVQLIGSGGRGREGQTREGDFCRGTSHLPSSRWSNLKSMGFDMQALQPDCRNLCCSVTNAWAVTAMTGIPENLGCWRIQAARESPSSLPSWTSSGVELLALEQALRATQIFRTVNYIVLRFTL